MVTKKIEKIIRKFFLIGGMIIHGFLGEFAIAFGSVYISLGTYRSLVDKVATDYTNIGIIMLVFGIALKVAYEYDKLPLKMKS